MFQFNIKARNSNGRKGTLLFVKSFFVLLAFVIIVIPKNVLAEDVTSTNFTIFANSPNTAGARSTSTNFILESTLGELSGVTTSTNFSSRSGFQAIGAEPKITMALSTNTINLGTLDAGSVNTANLTVTVTTNASSGYTVKLSENENLRSAAGNDIDDVLDGSVTAGSEEYGIRTSGISGLSNSTDAAISGAVNIASKSTSAVAEQTTVTFKAAISNATFSAGYSHTVTFTAVANF